MIGELDDWTEWYEWYDTIRYDMICSAPVTKHDRFVWMNGWERVNSKCLLMMLRFKSQKLIFTQKLLISSQSIQCLFCS